MLSCQTTNLITLPYKYKTIHHKLQFTKAASPIAEKPFNDHIQMGMVCCHSKLSGQVEALLCLLGLYFQCSFCTCRKVSKLWNSPNRTQLQDDSNSSSKNFINTNTYSTILWTLHRKDFERHSQSALAYGLLASFWVTSLHADWRNAWKHIYPAVFHRYASYAFNVKSKIMFELKVIDFPCPI